ncbi:chain-length determining protein [Novosphingobium marinum]|uniref:Polysaccharide chain length determinant protein (PEP-CTERM system associated) n=1 Tax=Novosphingobium marinum TaxID=1514948 RepID=A0A7Y9XTA9_9SPHN|nr:XrtA system polysaccharide chain length determinant [Novosphingobium marinum]NYH94077.1 polysaccharide chain length determinant protein (PEP-CTERM system associated) [Novosphingobium marinum]GGC19412.1 chain-length determining protein [Novosphingobium marinum]
MNSLYDEALSALHSVWHRRWIALAVAWGVCLLGWLAVAMVPNSYESRSRIFVQLDDALAEQVGIGVADRKRDIERIRQTLTSAVNLEKVVRSTRIGDTINSPKDMEAAVLELAKDIKVVSQQDNLFEISAVSNDGSLSDAENAALAQDVVQKMIDIFREENLAGNRGEMTETLEFVNQQLAQREKELEVAEQRRLTFEAEHPEMIQGGAANQARLEASRSELRNVDADLAAAQSALAAIGGQISGTPRMLPGAAPVGSRASLAKAQGELAAMRSRGLTDSHPDIIALKNQIATLQSAVQNEASSVSGMPNPAYSSLQSIQAEREANVQALQARRAALQADIASLTATAINNPEVAAEAQRIGRDYDVLRQQYDKLLRDREELRLRGEIKTEREAVKFEVVDPPTTPRSPVAPNRPILLLAVLVAGLGAGAGAAFAIGQLRSTFATTAKLEKSTGLPVLGAISRTLTEAKRELRRKRQRYFYAATAGLGVVFALLLAVEFIQRGTVA